MAWFSLRVRKVPGSIRGVAHFFFKTNSRIGKCKPWWKGLRMRTMPGTWNFLLHSNWNGFPIKSAFICQCPCFLHFDIPLAAQLLLWRLQRPCAMGTESKCQTHPTDPEQVPNDAGKGWGFYELATSLNDWSFLVWNDSSSPIAIWPFWPDVRANKMPTLQSLLLL